MGDMRTARADPRDTTERGMTLIELLVSMTAFSLVIATLTGALIAVMTTTRAATDRADAQFELRQGLADITKQIRSGNVLFSPKDEPLNVLSCKASATDDSGTCMRIFTQTNRIPRCVQWQVLQVTAADGGAVLRTRTWSPDWGTDGDVSSWSTVARNLSLAAGFATDPTLMPFKLRGANTPYDRRLLQVDLLSYDKDNNRNVSIESSISGRNTSYGYDTGQCVPVPAE